MKLRRRFTEPKIGRQAQNRHADEDRRDHGQHDEDVAPFQQKGDTRHRRQQCQRQSRHIPHDHVLALHLPFHNAADPPIPRREPLGTIDVNDHQLRKCGILNDSVAKHLLCLSAGVQRTRGELFHIVGNNRRQLDYPLTQFRVSRNVALNALALTL